MNDKGVYVYDDNISDWIKIKDEVVVAGSGESTPDEGATPDETPLIQGVELRQEIIEPRYGYKCLWLESSSNARQAIVWDSIGSVSDSEILTLINFPSYDSRTTNDHRLNHAYVFLRASGSAGNETGYQVRLTDSDGYAYLAKYVNGVNTSMDAGSVKILGSRQYWLRFRAEGVNISFKIWESHEAEPASWDVETTDTDISSGFVGVGMFASGELEYHVVSVDLNGGTAHYPADINDTDVSASQHITFFEESIDTLPSGWVSIWNQRLAEVKYAHFCTPSQTFLDSIHEDNLAFMHAIGIAWDIDLGLGVIAFARGNVGNQTNRPLIFSETAFTSLLPSKPKEVTAIFKLTTEFNSHWSNIVTYPKVINGTISALFYNRFGTQNHAVAYREEGNYESLGSGSGQSIESSVWVYHRNIVWYLDKTAKGIGSYSTTPALLEKNEREEQLFVAPDLSDSIDSIGLTISGTTGVSGWYYGYVARPHIKLFNVDIGDNVPSTLPMSFEDGEWTETATATGVYIVSSTSHDLSGSSSTATIPRPDQVVEDDLMVAQIMHRNENGPIAPAGWTLETNDKANGDDFGQWQSIYTKIATDDEPNSYLWSDGGTRCGGGIIALRGVGSQLSVVNIEYELNHGAPQLASPTNNRSIALYMSNCAYGGGEFNFPQEVTELYGGERIACGYEVFNQEGVTPKRTVTHTGPSSHIEGSHSIMIALGV